MKDNVKDNVKVHTYYLTRDSNCSGDVSPAIHVWYIKPIRRKLPKFDKGYIWGPEVPDNLGLYGAYTVDHARKAFGGAIPDTDLELIKCEQNAIETLTERS